MSLGATFNNPQLASVYNWFSTRLQGLQSQDNANTLLVPLGIVDRNPSLLARLKQMLKDTDLGIVDLAIDDNLLSPGVLRERKSELRDLNALSSLEKEGRTVSVRVFHQSSEGSVPLDLESGESHGTRQLFRLGAIALSVLTEGAVLLVDELDTSLHPLLVRWLVSLFHDPAANPRNAQLIFNTHDTSLLSALLFRRDQIWLVEKNRQGASTAYSLLDYSPRKDEALEKGYLQGRYGAIPFLGAPLEAVIEDAEA